jgi:hypothetical protein
LIRSLAVLALAWACAAPLQAAEPRTVCTITVNSADEKEAFRRWLPASKYRFVELVERDRSDWLESACRSGVRCDVLIVSGHYDGGNEFFSDQLEVREFLPVAELERVSCNGACPGLFAQLKEVYLFGCNTLNPLPQSGASAEIVRSLVRDGRSRPKAEKYLRSLNASRGESSLERMRQVFEDVPVIYGFASTAPLGPIAATVLNRYLRANGDRELASGRRSDRLLAAFAPFSMTATGGLAERDPLLAARQDMCQFADDRPSDADKFDFVHRLLQRDVAEVRLYLDRVRTLTKALDDSLPQTPDEARARERIAYDAAARSRYMDYVHELGEAPVRVRMLDLARDLGWLTTEERWDELALMLRELQQRREVGTAEVTLACTLNAAHDLDGAFERRAKPGSAGDDIAHAAVRACLGSADDRERTLGALVGSDGQAVQVAQAYLHLRPITDGGELRRLSSAITRMKASDAQVRALEALGRHYLSDRAILDELTQLFAQTRSAAVQSAIAGILVRADPRSLHAPQLAATLREHRLPAAKGDGMIDALLGKLRSH